MLVSARRSLPSARCDLEVDAVPAQLDVPGQSHVTHRVRVAHPEHLQEAGLVPDAIGCVTEPVLLAGDLGVEEDRWIEGREPVGVRSSRRQTSDTVARRARCPGRPNDCW